MIELIVTVSIFALLVALTVPAMRLWVANTKVRAAADTLQNGIRLAQAEAQRRGRQVVFALTSTPTPVAGFTAVTQGSYWAVQTVPLMTDGTDSAAIIASSGLSTSSGGAVQITAGTAQNQTALCFNSLGRLVANATPGPAYATCTTPSAGVNANTQPGFTYIVSAVGADRTLQVEVAMGGQLHLCDASAGQSSLASGNPYGC